MSLTDLEFYSELPVEKDATIEDLVELYGKEAARRGVQYMSSLSDAEESYRDSIDPSDMERGYEEGLGVDGGEGNVSEVASSWSEKMEESGLGISASDDNDE